MSMPFESYQLTMMIKNEVSHVKSYNPNPLSRILKYRNSYNEYALLAYILFTFISVIWIVYSTYKCISSSRRRMILKQLYIASSENDISRCTQLIKKYPHLINMRYQSYTPFMVACLNGHTNIVEIMLDAGGDVHSKSVDNESPFYLAVYYHIKNPTAKDASCIHALYHAGSDVNEVNQKGYNALQLAAAYGHTSLVRWLIAKGARAPCV